MKRKQNRNVNIMEEEQFLEFCAIGMYVILIRVGGGLYISFCMCFVFSTLAKINNCSVGNKISDYIYNHYDSK